MRLVDREDETYNSQIRLYHAHVKGYGPSHACVPKLLLGEGWRGVLVSVCKVADAEHSLRMGDVPRRKQGGDNVQRTLAPSISTFQAGEWWMWVRIIVTSNSTSKQERTKKGVTVARNPLDCLVAGVRFELTTFGL